VSVALVVLHVVVCIFLIAVVLLQRGKGAEIGAVFGGGASGTVFGSRGAGNFLTKLTTVCATIFMLTSLTISYFWSAGSEDRLFRDEVVEEAPAEAPPVEGLGSAPPAEAGDESDFVEIEPGEAPGAPAPEGSEPTP
jgi:preprotein translocase subunit SecG